MNTAKTTATRIFLAAMSLNIALPGQALAAGRSKGARQRPSQAQRQSEVRVPERRTERRHDRRDWDDRNDHRHDRRDHRRDHRRDDRRFRDWNDWVEFRLKVAGARLLAGMMFDALSDDTTVIIIDGIAYHVSDDVYFIKVMQVDGSVVYQVVNPPAGARFRVLRPGAKRIVLRGTTYHVLDGVHYIKSGGQFVVVAAP